MSPRCPSPGAAAGCDGRRSGCDAQQARARQRREFSMHMPHSFTADLIEDTVTVDAWNYGLQYGTRVRPGVSTHHGLVGLRA